MDHFSSADFVPNLLHGELIFAGGPRQVVRAAVINLMLEVGQLFVIAFQKAAPRTLQDHRVAKGQHPQTKPVGEMAGNKRNTANGFVNENRLPLGGSNAS
jgi:hypothetical protein